nr:c2h2 finger domain transcription factor con7 [Quercus suber]
MDVSCPQRMGEYAGTREQSRQLDALASAGHGCTHGDICPSLQAWSCVNDQVHRSRTAGALPHPPPLSSPVLEAAGSVSCSVARCWLAVERSPRSPGVNAAGHDWEGTEKRGKYSEGLAGHGRETERTATPAAAAADDDDDDDDAHDHDDDDGAVHAAGGVLEMAAACCQACSTPQPGLVLCARVRLSARALVTDSASLADLTTTLAPRVPVASAPVPAPHAILHSSPDCRTDSVQCTGLVVVIVRLVARSRYRRSKQCHHRHHPGPGQATPKDPVATSPLPAGQGDSASGIRCSVSPPPFDQSPTGVALAADSFPRSCVRASVFQTSSRTCGSNLKARSTLAAVLIRYRNRRANRRNLGAPRRPLAGSQPSAESQPNPEGLFPTQVSPHRATLLQVDAIPTSSLAQAPGVTVQSHTTGAATCCSFDPRRSMSKAFNNANHNEPSLSAILASTLRHDDDHRPQSMDGRQPEYPQSGLSSPFAPHSGHLSEGSSADQASAVQYQSGDYKSSNFSASATPSSEYGLPQSARSGSFPEYVQRSYADGQQARYPTSAQGGHAAMAQTSSPSLSLPDGEHANGHHPPHNMKSDGDVPIDPSIAQASPSYPPPQNYSPYPPQHEMHQYPGQMPQYGGGRPEWAGHYQQPMGYGHSPATSGGPPSSMGGHPLSTVYSFVPIPGAQQHKRPRRRYEEIERMYKCGWNGCEKAYGTLNHLNAHVTMQSHGTKRTPEEFKEIRKEWKAKKKEEDNARKQEEERQRQEAARSGQDGGQAPGQSGQYGQHAVMAQQMGGPHLPPIGYQQAGGQAPGQYAQQQQVEGSSQYANGSQMYPGQSYPQSPSGADDVSLVPSTIVSGACGDRLDFLWRLCILVDHFPFSLVFFREDFSLLLILAFLERLHRRG